MRSTGVVLFASILIVLCGSSLEAQDVEYSLKIVDMADVGLPKDLGGNYVGSSEVTTLKLQVWVEDLRGTGTAGGVYAAYADLAYDKDLVDWVGGSIAYDADFANGRSGTIDEANRLVDEAGAFHQSFTPVGDDPQHLLTVNFNITGLLGYPDDIVTFSTSPADEMPAHYTLVYGSNNPVPDAAIVFGSASLVPEPGCLSLLALAGLAVLRRRRDTGAN